MTLKKIASLLKNHSLVSIFALVASKLVYLFTTLVLTNFMGIDDFGIVSVFMSYVTLFIPIVTLNIYSGFGRYLYDENFSLNNQVVNTLGFGILVISLFEIYFKYQQRTSAKIHPDKTEMTTDNYVHNNKLNMNPMFVTIK